MVVNECRYSMRPTALSLEPLRAMHSYGSQRKPAVTPMIDNIRWFVICVVAEDLVKYYLTIQSRMPPTGSNGLIDKRQYVV